MKRVEDDSDFEINFSENSSILNDNVMFDTNEDLPIRKAQSAYVIFGKMVNLKGSIHT